MNSRFLIVFFWSIVFKLSATHYVVTSVNDNTSTITSGELRWAITQANANPGLDYIDFNITGGNPHVIQLNADLPVVTSGIVIDGNTQPGSVSGGQKKIHIRGSTSNNYVFFFAFQYSNIVPSTVINLKLSQAINAVLFFHQTASGKNVINNNIIFNYGTTAPLYRLVTLYCNDNVLKGNIIGTDETLSTNTNFNTEGCIDISYDGVTCITSNIIGGLSAGEANLLYNGRVITGLGAGLGVAVQVNTGQNNIISGNTFINNQLNIGFLGASSCSPNNMRPVPSFYYSIAGGVASIQGTSSPNDFIEIYKSGPLWGDATSLLGTTTANGSGQFSTTISGLAANEKLIATGTNPQNNTSEFSYPCPSQGNLSGPGILCENDPFYFSYSVTPVVTNVPGTSVSFTNSVFGTYMYSSSSYTNGPYGGGTNEGQVYTLGEPNPAIGNYTISFTFQRTAHRLNGAVVMDPFACPVITLTVPLVVKSCTVPPIPCADCISSFAPTPGKKYLVSAWAKESGAAQSVTAYTKPQLTVLFPSVSGSVGPFIPTGAIIDGWQRIEGEFTIPASATDISLKLDCTSGDCFYDDVRVLPFDGSMKSYVYDPVTMRLVAELDERNYATLYEYDEEGKLIRVKKETEKGIMTIQENRNNTKK